MRNQVTRNKIIRDDKKYLDKLRDYGLHVSPPIPAYRGGVWIKNLATMKGHYIPEFDSDYISFEEDPDYQPETNAPMIAFYKDQSSWVVDRNGSLESVGPGDFLNKWATPEEAIEDILDFYFGDSSRMIELAFAHGKFLGSLEMFNKMKAESKQDELQVWDSWLYSAMKYTGCLLVKIRQ